MDLLFKRYASPFLFMDGMIQTCRFCEFINSLADAKKEDEMYQYFLHKVWDKTYNEFKEMCQVEQDNRQMSEQEIETTLKHSITILNNFNPEV